VSRHRRNHGRSGSRSSLYRPSDFGNRSKKECKASKKPKNIFAVINNHHWMLVTLLLINAACLETLPIYLNKAVDELIAIAIAVIGVLFIG